MVPPGEDPGEQPSTDHKEGFRLVVKMAEELGGDVRELMSTALAAWNAIDASYRVPQAGTRASRNLPVVELFDVIENKTASGSSFIPMLQDRRLGAASSRHAEGKTRNRRQR